MGMRSSDGGPPRGELVDRETEFGVLAGAVADAVAGRARVVVIDAEPGMGKSALLEEFVGRQRQARVRWLRCDEFESDVAFAGTERLAGAEAVPRGRSEVEVGRRMLAWLGEQQPASGVLLLVVDDAQWLDRSSSHALAFALRRLGADHVLTVIAHRHGAGPPAVLTEDPSATSVLRLRPLAAGAVRALAARLRSWELSDEVAARLVERTHGVPLLVAEAIRGAASPDQLAAPGDVPGTIASAVLRMLASVDAGTRGLVEAAAVFGEPASVVVLGHLTELTDPAGQVAAGVAAGLLRLRPDSSVGCAHDLVQDAVYRGLPASRRRDLHRRAAEQTLGDRRLAHRAEASDRPDPELVDELTAAADGARAVQRYALAATHRLRARSVCAVPALREELLLEAVIDRVSAQDLAGARELAALLGQGRDSTLHDLALGLLARESGDVPEARRLLRDALSRAIADGDAALAARAGLAQGVLAVRLNEGLAAVESVARAERADDPEIAADALTTKALGLWQLGESERAIGVLDEALSASGDASWDADVLAVRAMVRQYAGHLEDALTDYDAAVALEAVWRPSTNHSRTRVLRAVTRHALGDWDGAAIDAAAARALAQGEAQAWSIPLAYAVSVDVPAWRGLFDVAAAYLEVAEAGLRVLSSPQAVDFVVERRLTLAMARGDHDAAADLLEPLLRSDHLERAGIVRIHRWPLQCWTICRLRAGDLAGAAEALTDYERSLERWPGGAMPPRLGWLRGQLAEARGEPLSAREHYAADLLCAETARTPHALAELLLAMGRLERVLGNRRDAVEHLTRARQLFHRLRATPGETACTSELAACGLQSRLSDPLSLTPREQDVVSLVARGCTNKEVAAELYLTAKTVEYHLRNIFTKLGISSRQELRRLGQV